MCIKFKTNISLKKSLLSLAITTMAAWSLSAFASGNYSKMDHGKMDHGKMDHGKKSQVEKTKNATRKALDVASKASVVKVLEANEELHTAFFNYDAKKVEESAKKLKGQIDKVNNPEIAKLLKFSKTKLSEISSSKSRDDNNQNYHLISMALIHLVNTYDVGNMYNSYSCPMVKKKWVQNSKKIAKVHNPYAPNMPHCGSKDSNY